MKTNKINRIAAFALAICMLLPLFTVASSAADAWTLQEDTAIYWAATEDSQSSDEALSAQIQLFARELADKVTKETLSVLYGDSARAGEKDILLVLDSTLGIAAQGYSIEVNGTSLTVNASDADGLFYGCRNVIQQLLVTGSVSSVSDAPDVAERVLSLDNGRKYYTVDWIKQLIREMSWSNLNTLLLHFSEEMGLGLESKLYPWLNGRDGTLCVAAEIDSDNRCLTQQELAEIVAYANLYHVDIVPAFDSPGHLNYLVKKFNEKAAESAFAFEYDGITYNVPQNTDIGNYYNYNGEQHIVEGSRNKAYSRGIDITNKIGAAFVKSLLTEYAELFNKLGSTAIDIGGDELLGWGSAVVSASSVSRWKQLDHWKAYAQERAKAEGNTNYAQAVAYDGFMYYMNDLYDLVTELGYTSVRMWNDDALRSADTGWNGVVQLNQNIRIQYWTPSASGSSNTIWTYLNAGYKAYNLLNKYNYYVLGDTDYAGCNQKDIYNSWSPYVFDPDNSEPGAGKNTSQGNPNILGSAFCIWCDNPAAETEEYVMEQILPMLRANGAKAWDAAAHESVNYTTFAANLEMLGGAPEVESIDAPGIGSSLDTAALESALLVYESTDASLYTAESFTAYKNEAARAYAVLADGTASQETVDAVAAQLMKMQEYLRPTESVSTGSWLLSAAFRSTRVIAGRAPTLTVGTVRDANIVSYEIYDDEGNRVEITGLQEGAYNRRKPTLRYHYISFIAEGSGTRTYTVYAVDENGNRSADCRTCSITVR